MSGSTEFMLGLRNKVDSGRAAIEQLKQELDAAKTGRCRNGREEPALLRRPNSAWPRRLAVQPHPGHEDRPGTDRLDLCPRTSMVEIVDRGHAERPPRCAPTRPLNIALGIIIGLVVGVGLAFFIEYLDTSVKTIDDVERSLQCARAGRHPAECRLAAGGRGGKPARRGLPRAAHQPSVLAQGRQAQHRRRRQRRRRRRQIHHRLQPRHGLRPERAAGPDGGLRPAPPHPAQDAAA